MIEKTPEIRENILHHLMTQYPLHFGQLNHTLLPDLKKKTTFCYFLSFFNTSKLSLFSEKFQKQKYVDWILLEYLKSKECQPTVHQILEQAIVLLFQFTLNISITKYYNHFAEFLQYRADPEAQKMLLHLVFTNRDKIKFNQKCRENFVETIAKVICSGEAEPFEIKLLHFYQANDFLVKYYFQKEMYEELEQLIWEIKEIWSSIQALEDFFSRIQSFGFLDSFLLKLSTLKEINN